MKTIIKLIWLMLPLLVLFQSLLSPITTQSQSGKFDLTLWVVPGDSADKVKPGQENHMFLQVRNNGNSSITGLRFSSNAPDNWMVVFNPPSLEALSSGSNYAIDVIVIPSSDTGNGNYAVSLIATANETRAVTSAFLRVQGGFSVWVWVGFGAVGLIIILFIFIYFRYGRK